MNKGFSLKLVSSFCLLILAGIVLSGCATSAQAQQAPTLQPTETAVPLTTPTALPEVAPIALPEVNWDDPAVLAAHKKAMKPAFESDVDRFVKSNRYLIIANLDLSKDAVIRGAERVRYTNQSNDALDIVVFRLYPNGPTLGGRSTVTSITANGVAVEPSYSTLRSVMGVPLPEPLKPGESVEFKIDFSVVMTRNLFTAYGRFGYVNDVVSSTSWYPTLSVYEPEHGWWSELPNPNGDPGYSEIGLYDVRLTVPSDLTVAMSGTIIETTDNGNGTTTYRDVTGPMRDHAFQASKRYMITSQDVDGTTVNVVSYKDRAALKTDGTQDALKFGVQSVDIYNQVFGEYPYKELDIVRNPTPSGVEFPGLVQIAQTAWMKGQPYLEIVIAHEVGHQWFYGLVGNNQVDHPWLDESLTSYTEIVYMRLLR
ncbi:MAG: M1 family metallopeptidase [Anaerolineae bacterium]